METLGAMLDRLFQVHFDRPHGDPEAPGDFAMRHVFDPRKDQHAPPALGQLRDRALEQMDLRAALDFTRGVGPIVGNIEETVDLVDRQSAVFGPAAVVGNIKGDAEQISLRTSQRSDLVHPFEPQISFLKHVGGKIRRAKPTRQAPIESSVIGKQQIPQSRYVRIAHITPAPYAIPIDGDRNEPGQRYCDVDKIDNQNAMILLL